MKTSLYRPMFQSLREVARAAGFFLALQALKVLSTFSLVSLLSSKVQSLPLGVYRMSNHYIYVPDIIAIFWRPVSNRSHLFVCPADLAVLLYVGIEPMASRNFSTGPGYIPINPNNCCCSFGFLGEFLLYGVVRGIGEFFRVNMLLLLRWGGLVTPGSGCDLSMSYISFPSPKYESPCAAMGVPP